MAKNHFQALERLNIQYIKPEEVKPNSYNPNRQSDRDFELLLKSMKIGSMQTLCCLSLKVFWKLQT